MTRDSGKGLFLEVHAYVRGERVYAQLDEREMRRREEEEEELMGK